MRKSLEGKRHTRKTGYQQRPTRKSKIGRIKRHYLTPAVPQRQKQRHGKNIVKKNSVKRDKREFLEGHAKQAEEEEAASRNMKQLYDTKKTLAGKFQLVERPS